jgi:hypothetical protein
MNQLSLKSEEDVIKKLSSLKNEIDEIKLQQKEIIELLKNKSGKS